MLDFLSRTVDFDIAAILLDNTVHHGQTDADALPYFFGGEKGSKRCDMTSGLMPSPVSLTVSLT